MLIIVIVLYNRPMLHYKAVSRTRVQKILDVSLCVFGVIVMVYTTTLTVSSWIRGGDAKSPGYCDDK